MNDELLARYDGLRLPRYTSYPTAPHFTEAVDGATRIAWLAALPEETDLSLYLHVPFCAALCLYCGCHTTVVRRYDPVAAYADLLVREIAMTAAAGAPRGPVTHLHWGGGTPTLLSGGDLRRVMRAIGRHFRLADAAEIAVEIDPRSPGDVDALAAIGVNRASLGVQSFDPKVQAAIGREQSFAQTRAAAERLRAAGIARLNLDLMYGLPHQSAESLAETTTRALALDPDRVSLFGYAHVPAMKRHQALLPAEALPDGPARLAQFEAAAACLSAAGYVRVGLDHFAKAADPLVAALEAGALRRNFQGYTTDAAPALIGFGASAISALPQGYAQNAATVPAYARLIEAGRVPTVRGLALTAEDRLRRAVIERLMCDFAVDLDAVCAEHGVATDLFATELARLDALCGDGLAHRDRERIAVTEAGRPLVRVVAAVFDARLARAPATHAPAL
ncbi:oxygen-independent coproporphyrinogen III oxidase [Methylobacterium organophilum]|uniref:oxygen-independent coproporphyrinogen III oxidase n=1 Tax=Methylobacterium organophilum TaxID=410 RepID=UPI001F138F92|nr:oxygen-independent coproporphyrinogen III oxidase [Methylobacterium organophilum]UMY16154.1 oxygen-independent coproporphyrinogen III oxidase [Methylobacterium organophilum]